MINEKTLLGYPTEIPKLGLIYPPKIKDVVGNDKFYIYAKILTISQEEIEDEWVKAGLDMSGLLNPLEYLLNNSFHSSEFLVNLKEAFLFFMHEPATILFNQKAIVIGEINEEIKSLDDLSKMRTITEDNFLMFQNVIRDMIGEKRCSPPDPTESPRAKQMKAKARYRDKIKAKQQGLKLGTLILSLCCMNYGLNLLNIGELSYAAVSPLMTMYQEKEKYETDIKSLLAGADSKKVKPKYWIHNIED